MKALFKEAGIENPEIAIQAGVYTQPSIDYFLESEVKGSPLYRLFDDESYPAFLEETREALASFLLPNGALVLPMDATIVKAKKTG